MYLVIGILYKEISMKPNPDRKVETINNINDNNNINNTNDTNDMASSHLYENKRASFASSSRPLGPCGSPDTESGQEAKGVMESRPLLLAEERAALIANGRWIFQPDIDYVKVSFWLQEPNNPHSLKMKYSFKRTNQTDLKYNNFSIKLTRNRFDYIRNVDAKWPDHKLVNPVYAYTAQTMQEYSRAGGVIYAGKAQATRGYSQRIMKVPLEPVASAMLWHDTAEDAMTLELQHHDFKLTLEYPMALWAEEMVSWSDAWAIQIEQKRNRPRNVPPFVTMTWRSI